MTKRPIQVEWVSEIRDRSGKFIGSDIKIPESFVKNFLMLLK